MTNRDSETKINFAAIPQFPRGDSSLDIPFNFLEKHLEQMAPLGLELNPDYQRDLCWSTEQKTRFIEYVLRGGEHGKTLVFNHSHWQTLGGGRYELLDGKQRLDACLGFVRNEIPVFGGYFYRDGEPNFRSTQWIQIKTIALKTREEILQYYLDLNDGGVAHTELDIGKVRFLLECERREKRL